VAASTISKAEFQQLSFGGFPEPSADSDIAIPEPMTPFPKPEGQINILLMGSDQRPNDGGFRTDVLLLVSLNRDSGTATLTSFPRDLYVYQPGWRMDRINSAQARGGFALTEMTFAYNFGVEIDHWVLVNFGGFQSIVDALGGVTVNVGQALTDHREGYKDFSVPAGSMPMDGETALWYVRSRGTSSDFDRLRRQQEVLQAIFYRLLSLNAISSAPQLYEQYKQTVSTDLGIGDILPLLPLASQLGDSSQINRYVIGPNDIDFYRTSGGSSVLIPKRAALTSILGQALGAP
jgi:LCP family protein required for cell wall assembly